MIVKPLAEGLAAVQVAAKKGPPPVHLWHPPFCGDIDMRIARDGNWFHEGSPIGRMPMVKLFSSILRREGDEYFLVTPVEKVRIRVDDAPMLAVDFEVEGEGQSQLLRFFTKTEDEVVANAANPIRVDRGAGGEPSPYVHIRAGLEALIDRKSFYRLIELGVHETHQGESWFGLWSDGCFFPLIPSLELR
ncbi:MAG: DUF1285 domain-containing protein [Cypionkella sp.]|uniref:DUF1285 domain-containing protein n=1 Tax=Cypionkella sp. TaxID=2811411 RepID=UPI002ABAD874|nr:DUF1285 domain-containing protein [Cypionkella sp.]MDZ4310124.1 DUF1285 domain-containing protein [Cypionkella sp.]MDZ4394804.1 DUF1285 domain-containing protein [Cypionkella sp.]